MKKQSAGLLVFRRKGAQVEVLLVHPGGPFWAKKDLGAWSIPKGEFEEGENPLDVARREFKEETGHNPPSGQYISLDSRKQPSGKVVLAWAVQGDLDAANITSNAFEMEWPPKSGKTGVFPEVDKAAWFDLAEAVRKLHKGQDVFLERLAEILKVNIKPAESPQLNLL